MEVHHHAHTPRKKWTHYFWEFLMLFLAVFCGFLAENQREHMIEHQREKKYMRLLVEDLNKDTAWLQQAMIFNAYLVKGMDTLRESVYRIGIDPKAVSNVYVYSRQYLRPLTFGYTDRTSAQLKNSGALRLIQNEKVTTSILEYWNGIEVSRFLQDRALGFLNRTIEYRNKLLDSRYFLDADYDNEVFPIKNNPLLLH
jgi:hypothetical protein